MNKIGSVLKVTRTKEQRIKYFKDNYLNLIYMIPVLVGIFVFTILPMVVSFVYSLCEMDLLSPKAKLGDPSFFYYIKAFSSDWGTVKQSYYVTFRYAIVAGAVSFVGSYIVALILNQKLKGIKVFRILFYAPCLIPGLAGSLLWNGITKQTGYFNLILTSVGLEPYTFYSANNTVFATQLLLSGWGFSGNMIMWLAQFKNIPNELYEEASLSGARYFKQLFNITIPMSTSMIFYLLIMNIIGTLQSFMAYAVYVDNGRPSEMLFVGTHIYEMAYINFDISYACALSWILFVVIAIFTALVFTTSKKWVFYAEEY